MICRYMKKLVLSASVTGLSLIGFTTGCASQGARTIDTGSSESITSIDHIDDQDWANAAKKLTTSMVNTDGLLMSNPDGSKKLLAISRFINNSGENVDTDLIIKPIRVILFKTGKVEVTSIGGLSVEDPLAAQNKAKTDFATGDGHPNTIAELPDYTLSGKLIQNNARAGNIRQSTFYFQMSLSNKKGIVVWEDQTPITKIGDRNSVGL